MEKQPWAAATGRYYFSSIIRGLESVKLSPSVLVTCNSIDLFRSTYWAREERNGSAPFGQKP
jgi:hypothetical protein